MSPSDGTVTSRRAEEHLLERRALGDKLVQDDAFAMRELTHLGGVNPLADRTQARLTLIASPEALAATGLELEDLTDRTRDRSCG